MNAELAKSETPELLEFMFRLGQAYLAAGEQTAKVELVLRRVATAHGVRRSRVVAFPTAIFISVHEGAEERVTLAEGPAETLRLDQIADVYNLGDAAQRGDLRPRDGLKQLNEILKKTPRFGLAGNVLGHAILAIGVAMVLLATPYNLSAAGLLGAAVGLVKALNRNRAVLAVPLPVIAAAIVSALTYLAIGYGLPVDPLHALVPPLVTFLPGAMLTLGMVELAYGDMVSGSSRLVTGFIQLVLLVFGLGAGAILVGYRPENLADAAEEIVAARWTAWLPWAGVVVFGTGVYLHFSAPRNSWLWMLVVLLAAFAAQQIAAVQFGRTASGFFGMLVATPLSYLIHLRFKGPPAVVTFLPAFWLLVPGALGLLSVKQMLGDRAAGLDGMITTVFVFASVALGTLMGASLYKWLTERFGAWQLQLGRAGSYLRRRDKR
ncbi:MAG: threonine/serine exporter ThrE family protein [Pirellulales bacterium]